MKQPNYRTSTPVYRLSPKLQLWLEQRSDISERGLSLLIHHASIPLGQTKPEKASVLLWISKDEKYFVVSYNVKDLSVTNIIPQESHTDCAFKICQSHYDEARRSVETKPALTALLDY